MFDKKIKLLRKILLFWTLFIGIGALFGGSLMLIEPNGEIFGFYALLPYFQVLPFSEVLFQDFIFSGIALIIVNGISNIIASIFIVFKKESKIGVKLGMIFGITLMLWIIIQFIIFPLNFMSTIYFIFGLLQFLTGLICLIRYKQKEFVFNIDEYCDINQDKSKVVVYFSRMGYTKKIAYSIADEKKAYIYEIKTFEKTDGDLGFWWCGRFGLHKWKMRIEDVKIDFDKIKEITICTPIWVFNISAPIRCFFENYKNELSNVKINYCFNHFIKMSFKNLPKKIDSYYNIEHNMIYEYSCNYGKIKKLK